MQGMIDGSNKEYLLNLLNVSKTLAKSAKSKEDKEDEAISNEHCQIINEEIDLNEAEITNIYVSNDSMTYF